MNQQNMSTKCMKTEHIEAALFTHKGKDARLIKWKTESFLEEADNYSSNILRINLEYEFSAQIKELSYVAKIRQESNDEMSQNVTHIEFTKDSGFYQTILPKLSIILRECGIEDIRVPRCFFISMKKGEELLILEDLRGRNFRMRNRTSSLDVPHACLVLKELAKLHASSCILQTMNGCLDLKDSYPVLLRTIKDTRAFLDDIVTISAENSLRVLKDLGGYVRAVEWLTERRGKCPEIIYEHLLAKSPFEVICQGDCWNNNFLFRYNENNEPVEVMLLDFQDLKKSSLATELNELMYTSLDGPTRKSNINSFLEIYHESFRRVLEASRTSVQFTLESLHQEYTRRMELGLLLGIVTVPWMICGDEGLQWYEGPDDDKRIEEFRDDLRVRTIKKLTSDPEMQHRFLSIFDDMLEAGVM